LGQASHEDSAIQEKYSMVTKKLKIGKKYLQAFSDKLGKKNLVLIKGRKGYVMCGYLNMKAANAFDDVAVKITGVANINDALRARAYSVSRAGRRLGIRRNQPIKDVLAIIA